MPRILDPAKTSRAAAFEQWKHSAMPFVTLTKTFDVSPLVRSDRRFNALLCWCIGQAASRLAQFYRLPAADAFLEYDRLALDVLVRTPAGRLVSCDIPFSQDLDAFCRDYDRLTKAARETGKPQELSEDWMIIGTSALPVTELDSAVNACSPWPNPFLIWGRIRQDKTLPVSFQFHHAQMDGYEAALFLEGLQDAISSLAA